MSLIQKTLLGVSALALVASVGCGKSNNETNNSTTGVNNTSGSNNTTGGSNNTTGGPNNTTGGSNNTTGGSNNTTGGSNNTTGGGGATFCRLECAEAADCGANEADWECNANRCEYVGEVAGGCTQTEECVATFSGWVTECQADADCPGQVCIATGDADAGRCATEAGGVVACDTLMQSDFDTLKYEDNSPVTVCANTSSECHDDGYCYVPCAEDADCGDLLCNTDTGTCYCDADEQCTGQGADKCYDGACGCADEASCDALEAGDTMFTCE